MMFRVGEKVICIDDDFAVSREDWEVYPQLNGIYTIRWIDPGDDACFLWLVEIVNPIAEYEGEIGEASFDAENFRPLVERKTETGFKILEGILHGAPVKENA